MHGDFLGVIIPKFAWDVCREIVEVVNFPWESVREKCSVEGNFFLVGGGDFPGEYDQKRIASETVWRKLVGRKILCRVTNVQGCVLTAYSLMVDEAKMYQTDNALDYR